MPIFGGGGGSRTPVRKHFLRNFSGRRRFFAFPHHDASRHASWFSSFICHAGGKAYPGHVHHSGHAQAQLVVLLGWTAAIKQRREQSCCCSLIYKVPVLRMSGTSARYSCPHVPVETSTPPNNRLFEWRTKGVRKPARQVPPFKKWEFPACCSARPLRAARLQAEKNLFTGKAGEKMISIHFPTAVGKYGKLSRSAEITSSRVRDSPRRRSQR